MELGLLRKWRLKRGLSRYVPEFVRQPPTYLPTLRPVPMEVRTALVLTLTLSSEDDPRIVLEG